MINPYLMFATGIENSAPMIDGRRVDQMDKCGHYADLERDFDLVGELGLTFLRYGMPLHTTFIGPGRFDWSFSDASSTRLKRVTSCRSPICVTLDARLARQLPEPGFSRAVRPLSPRLCNAQSMGSALHTNQRDVQLRNLLGAFRLVGRAAYGRPAIRHSPGAHRARQTDQVDWETAMRQDNGRINPLGLYDLDRAIRPVGPAYRQLIADWQHVLPTQSVCLVVPVMLPSEYDDPLARRRREWLRGMRAAAVKRGS